jgi:hypothetical protein
MITQYYQAHRLSPAVGASLGRALECAGYRQVRSEWTAGRADELMIENMLMVYDEIRDRLRALGIMTDEEISEQQRLLRALPVQGLPPAWGLFRATAVA